MILVQDNNVNGLLDVVNHFGRKVVGDFSDCLNIDNNKTVGVEKPTVIIIRVSRI